MLSSPASSVLPRAYGYMRVPCDVADDKVRRLENRVATYSKSHGLYLACFFSEFNCGSREAFEELISELVHTGVRHVVVPSLRHFSQNAFLQDIMLDRLNFSAQAQVLAVHLRTAIE